ncbi:NAD(P)-binding domain-containing protein [Nocardioides sp. 503]|uniref:NADPH-dependent F420 reductase n=1 Tax=Nocardioides sp. 503 TaxID=2508326 RepID=UPI00106F7CB0|nr:NAD(P)-binding domain-containing protein [Nocardioides sp. 503]
MTSIAILGSGRVSHSLAGGLAAAGHDVHVGSRDPGASAASFEGTGVSVVDVATAVAAASVVVNATPGDTSVERLSALAAELDGKVLVDVANATVRGEEGQPGGLLYPAGSLAEELQAALPGVRVVKTLNTMLFTVMAAPDSLSAAPTVFVSGDDAAAKAEVQGLLGDLGWPESQILDLGGVVSARGPESMILLVPHIMQARGMKPFALTVIS